MYYLLLIMNSVHIYVRNYKQHLIIKLCSFHYNELMFYHLKPGIIKLLKMQFANYNYVYISHTKNEFVTKLCTMLNIATGCDEIVYSEQGYNKPVTR